MNNFSFTWTARFKNEDIINQFNKDGTENKYKLVSDRHEDLMYFYLTNNIDKTFCLDLVHGLIFFNNHLPAYFSDKKLNIRPIFFDEYSYLMRRHTVGIGMNEEDLLYFLGFRYTDKEGNDLKMVIKIDECGNWVIGE